MKPYPIPGNALRREMMVANSRFISSLEPVSCVEEARAFISRIRSEFADASHNVPVFIIGHGSTETAHCSDDGEPSGTAGRPALAVLHGSGLGDVAVVVTRYFGGTKLGTGGLVRAYGDAVRLVVEEVPRAVKIPAHTIMLALPYARLESIRRLLARHGATIHDETFTADITITAEIITDNYPAFAAALQEYSAGTMNAEIIETNEKIIPIEHLRGNDVGNKTG